MKKRGLGRGAVRKSKRIIGKKAEFDTSHHLYLIMFELFIVTIIFLALVSYVKSLEKNTLFEKSYLSKDLSLLINTLYSSPGPVTYTYVNPELDLTEYEFRFAKNKATTAELWDSLEDNDFTLGAPTKGNPIYYPHAFNDKYLFEDDTILQNPYAIRFSLDTEILRMSSSDIAHSFQCPTISTPIPEGGAVLVIDAGHGEDTRFSSSTYGTGTGAFNLQDPLIREQDITLDLANSLASQVSTKADFITAILTRQSSTFVPLEDRIALISRDDVSIAISLHTGSDTDSDKETIKAYIFDSSPNIIKSEKLACLILKEYAKVYSDSLAGVEIIRLDKKHLKDMDPSYSVIETDNPMVLLEIGNIQIDDGLLNRPSPELASHIYKGIINYYN